MPQRLNGGALLAGLGGLLLLVSLFLDWYEPDLTAWDTFELADLVLLAAAAAGIAAVAGPLLRQRASDPERERVLLYIGIGALILVIASLIQPPPRADESSPEVGAWLGLVGAVLITTGGLVAGTGISLVITTRPRQSVTPPDGTEALRRESDQPPPPRAPGDQPVPPPPGTPPAEPESETSSIPTEPR